MKRKIQAAAVVVCLLVAGLAYGQSDDVPDVLKGIRSLQVVIELKVGDLNLRESDILRDVSLKLELAGIKVGTEPPQPWLYVNVLGADSGSGRWVVSTKIYLYASVITTLNWHKSRTVTTAELWSAPGQLLAGPKSTMARRVRDSFKDDMDDFLLDYVRANRAED